jgi:hypothetical protein
LLGKCAAPSIESLSAAATLQNSFSTFPNSFSNFICSFLAQLDKQIPIQDIKSKLSENISRNHFTGAGLIVRCPQAPTEHPCNFDPFNQSLFCAAAHQEISRNSCTCTCGSTHCHNANAGPDEPASLSACSIDGGVASASLPFDNDDFSVFKATVESENSFLSADLPCDPCSQYSTCAGRNYTRSSI